MPPIVNITPRTLPGAGSPDRLGLVTQAADLLLRNQEADEAAELRARELEEERSFRATQAELDRAHELAGITLRGMEQRRGQRLGGEIDERLIGRRGEVEGGLIGLRGEQARRTDEAGYELRAPDREREFGQRDRALDIQEGTAAARAEEGRLRGLTGLNESIFRMNRQLGLGGTSGTSGPSFPLQSFSRDLMEELALQNEEGLTPEQTRGLMDIAAGNPAGIEAAFGRTAGEASGRETRTPPREARGGPAPGVTEGPGGINMDVPGGRDTVSQYDRAPALSSQEIEELNTLPVESHVETLRALPYDDPMFEAYLRALSPQVQAQVLAEYEKRER